MKRALTLIEVLVVTAILSALASLLFPVLASSREAGRQAVCASNIRQLGFAFQSYATNWDDRYPDAGWVYAPRGAGWVYAPRPFVVEPEYGALYPLVGDWRIYQCPDWPAHPGYSMNAVVALAELSQIERPSSMLLLIEESERSTDGRGPNDGAVTPWDAWDRLSDRHNGGGLAAYCDGHAKWRFGNTLDREWGGAWPAAFTGGG